MKKFTLLFLSGVMLFASGCATIVGRSSYPVRIMSNPSQAAVTITTDLGNEVFRGETPATVILKSSTGYFKKAAYLVHIKKDGYNTQTYPIMASLNGWYLGNLFLGGVIGLLIVDPLTGAMFKIDTELVNANLVMESAANPNSNEHELRVMNLSDVPENWKAGLVRIN